MTGDCLGKLRIELVDDQALVRSALAQLLETAEGVEVVATAATVEDAARCAEELKPHIVLMDVLPDADIPEAVKQVSERCPQAAVIVVPSPPGAAASRAPAHASAAALFPPRARRRSGATVVRGRPCGSATASDEPMTSPASSIRVAHGHAPRLAAAGPAPRRAPR